MLNPYWCSAVTSAFLAEDHLHQMNHKHKGLPATLTEMGPVEHHTIDCCLYASQGP